MLVSGLALVLNSVGTNVELRIQEGSDIEIEAVARVSFI